MKKLLLNLMMVVGITTVSVAQENLVDSNATCSHPMVLKTGMNYDNYTTKGAVGYYKITKSNYTNHKIKFNAISKSEGKFSMRAPFETSCEELNNADDLLSLSKAGIWQDWFGVDGEIGKTYYLKVDSSTVDSLAIYYTEYLLPNDYFLHPQLIDITNEISINYADYTKFRDYSFYTNMKRDCKTSAHDTNTIDMYYKFIAKDTSMTLSLNMANPNDETLVQLASTYFNYPNLCIMNDDKGESNRNYVLNHLMVDSLYEIRLEVGMSNSNTAIQRKASPNNISLTLKTGTITAIKTSTTFVNFNIAPNPNKGSFTVQATEGEIFNIEILNSLGQKVAEYDNVNNGTLLNTNLNTGIYLIKSQSNKSVNSQKLVIE